MLNLRHFIDNQRMSTTPLRPRHAALPITLLLGMWLSLSLPMEGQSATYLEPAIADPSTVLDESAPAADDPDDNLVPLDTVGPATEGTNSPSVRTSSVPRAEDLLQLNPAGNSPATARFSDALNPPAELASAQDAPRSATAEYAAYDMPIVMDSSVQTHIRYFNTGIHDRFEQWLLRLSRYRPLVDKIFSEFHLPSDLV
jgi:membrane-bound lytic murein transglycosylase D